MELRGRSERTWTYVCMLFSFKHLSNDCSNLLVDKRTELHGAVFIYLQTWENKGTGNLNLTRSVSFDLLFTFSGVRVNVQYCAWLVLVSSVKASQVALSVWLSISLDTTETTFIHGSYLLVAKQGWNTEELTKAYKFRVHLNFLNVKSTCKSGCRLKV